MRPEYNNWVPKRLKHGMLCATVLLAILAVLCGALMPTGAGKTVLLAILVATCAVSGWFTRWCFVAYRAFSYDGDVKLSKRIVEGVASYVNVPSGGNCLDVGCGSGALTIAAAKRNPSARIVGCDRWGKEYDEFSQQLCERNAKAEGVSNVSFQPGDATHLPFPDESFDAVTSNYVYHNVPGHDKQELLLETLRVLRKGGTFAIHDLMGKARYGDMDDFVRRLKDMGYEEVRLVDTTDGTFMTKRESRRYLLLGSAVLCGRK